MNYKSYCGCCKCFTPHRIGNQSRKGGVKLACNCCSLFKIRWINFGGLKEWKDE